MWRSVFLAVGIVLCILGAECLVMEKAVLASDGPKVDQTAALFLPPAAQAGKEIKPPDWAPWSLMSSGAVIILYSSTLQRRTGG